MGIATYESFTYGQWNLYDGDTPAPPPNYPFNALIPVFDTDTSAAGAVFTLKRTGTETYELKLDSLDPLKADFGPVSRTFSGAPADYNNNLTVDAADYVVRRKMDGTGFDLENEVPDTSEGQVNAADHVEWKKRFGSVSGEVDWIEFTFFNPLTDTTPTLVEPGTDFYIRSMEIFGPAGASGEIPEPGTVVSLIVASAGLFMATSRPQH
jgi:hypothetical protein